MDEEKKPVEYISYNGMARRPMVWGVPFMAGLFIVAGSMLAGMMLGSYVGAAGWLVAGFAVPILIFVKALCVNDDRAIEILAIELKWAVIKKMGGNAALHGGTLAIAPTSYGRKLRHVKRYFETPVQR